MNLPMEIKTLYVVDYSDLEKFAEEITGLPWSMQQQGDMLHNGSFLRVTVDGESELFSFDDEERIEEWLNSDKSKAWEEELSFQRDNYINPEQMLHHLFVNGHIPAGEYLIEVCW